MDSSDEEGSKPGPSGYQNNLSRQTRSSSRLTARSAVPIPAHRESTIALSSSEDEEYETKFESDSEDLFKGFSSVSSSSSSSSSPPEKKKKKVLPKKSASPKAQRSRPQPALPQSGQQLISQSAVATAVAAALQDLSGVNTEPITSFNCNFCNKACFSMRYLDRHHCEGRTKMKKELKKEKAKQKVACVFCGKLVSAGSMARHVACKHVKDGKEHVCDVCGKKFENETKLRRHRETSCGDRYQCQICTFATGELQRLRRHILTHEKGDRKCADCELTFASSTDLRVHRRLVHADQFASCPNCGGLYPPKHLNTHVKSCNKVKPAEIPTEEDKLFKNKGGRFPLSELQLAMEASWAELKKKKLKPYELGEDGRWICDDCGEKFDDEEAVDDHHDETHVSIHKEPEEEI